MPVAIVPLTDEDRKKIIWRVGGSLLAFRVTIFLLVAAILCALYYSMQLYDLSLALRLGTAAILSAAALAACVYYRIYCRRFRLDEASDQKRVVLGMVVDDVSPFSDVEPETDEEGQSIPRSQMVLKLDIGLRNIPVRFSEILIVNKELYKNRNDIRRGDLYRADFSLHGDLLLDFRPVQLDDYDLFEDDVFSQENMGGVPEYPDANP